MRDFNSSSPTGLQRDFVSVDRLFGHADLYTTLPTGTYFLAYGDAFPIKPAWVSTVKVSGPVSNGTPPASSQPVTIASDDTLTVPSTLSPKQPLRITTTNRHEQVLYLFAVGASVSKTDVADFLAHPSPDRYDSLRPTAKIELAAVDGPAQLYITWHAKPGRYVIFNTAYGTGSKLYLDRGQVRQITVR